MFADKVIGAPNKVGDAKFIVIGRRGGNGIALQGSDHILPSRDLPRSRHLDRDLPSINFLGRHGASGSALQGSGNSLPNRDFFISSSASRDFFIPSSASHDLLHPDYLGRDLPSPGFLSRRGGSGTTLQGSSNSLPNRDYFSSSFPSHDLSRPGHLSRDLSSPTFPSRGFSNHELPNIGFPSYGISREFPDSHFPNPSFPKSDYPDISQVGLPVFKYWCFMIMAIIVLLWNSQRFLDTNMTKCVLPPWEIEEKLQLGLGMWLNGVRPII
ncbi:hypothetical protein V8G54_035627 [Vigna mungo]|uniref:Uncharacterized protein n=1 Tax=Vigna mungo TaxID=3915 RepID=A0AAQ3MG70_VIGMU